MIQGEIGVIVFYATIFTAVSDCFQSQTLQIRRHNMVSYIVRYILYHSIKVDIELYTKAWNNSKVVLDAKYHRLKNGVNCRKVDVVRVVLKRFAAGPVTPIAYPLDGVSHLPIEWEKKCPLFLLRLIPIDRFLVLCHGFTSVGTFLLRLSCFQRPRKI